MGKTGQILSTSLFSSKKHAEIIHNDGEHRRKIEDGISLLQCFPAITKLVIGLNALERLNGIKWIKCTSIVVLKDRYYDASYL